MRKPLFHTNFTNGIFAEVIIFTSLGNQEHNGSSESFKTILNSSLTLILLTNANSCFVCELETHLRFKTMFIVFGSKTKLLLLQLEVDYCIKMKLDYNNPQN